MKKTITGLLIAATLVLSPLATSSAQAQVPQSTYVTVHAEDTLGGIAYRHHTSWQHLAALNHLANPNRIYPGERIYITRSAPTKTVPKPVTKHKPVTKPKHRQTSGQKIVARGEAYRGVRYVWGGTSPSRGFDCSGFTQYTLARLGKSVSRVAEDQYRHSQHVRTPQPGDLFFVHDARGYVYHVGIYVNSHTWLEAEKPGRGVNLYKPWTHSVYYGRYTVK
jgi:cell wall-associated NlpC family hydrolase